jgi:hypothetical protein
MLSSLELPETQIQGLQKCRDLGLECGSVPQHLRSRHKAPGLIPSTKKKKKKVPGLRHPYPGATPQP